MCISLVWSLECVVQSRSWPLLTLLMLRCLGSPDAWCFPPCLPSPCPFLFLLHVCHPPLPPASPAWCFGSNNIGTVYFNLIVKCSSSVLLFSWGRDFFSLVRWLENACWMNKWHFLKERIQNTIHWIFKEKNFLISYNNHFTCDLWNWNYDSFLSQTWKDVSDYC